MKDLYLRLKSSIRFSGLVLWKESVLRELFLSSIFVVQRRDYHDANTNKLHTRTKNATTITSPSPFCTSSMQRLILTRYREELLHDKSTLNHTIACANQALHGGSTIALQFPRQLQAKCTVFY